MCVAYSILPLAWSGDGGMFESVRRWVEPGLLMREKGEEEDCLSASPCRWGCSLLSSLSLPLDFLLSCSYLGARRGIGGGFWKNFFGCL